MKPTLTAPRLFRDSGESSSARFRFFLVSRLDFSSTRFPGSGALVVSLDVSGDPRICPGTSLDVSGGVPGYIRGSPDMSGDTAGALDLGRRVEEESNCEARRSRNRADEDSLESLNSFGAVEIGFVAIHAMLTSLWPICFGKPCFRG